VGLWRFGGERGYFDVPTQCQHAGIGSEALRGRRGYNRGILRQGGRLRDSQYLVLFNTYRCVCRWCCVGRPGWSGSGAVLELCHADVGAAAVGVQGAVGV
jgi:hypothetical protein